MGINPKSLPEHVQKLIAATQDKKHKKSVQRHVPGVANQTEADYGALLEMRKVAGDIEDYHFEAITFKLGDNCRYTPDYMVEFYDKHKEIHEVKGFWRDDARVKIKWAAEKFRGFDFIAVQKKKKKDGGGWKIEEIKPAN